MVFFYNSLLVLILGILFKKRLKQNKTKKCYLLVCFFQMFLIQGLRSAEVGTDTQHYLTVFENFGKSEYYSFLFTHYEAGFATLLNVLRAINTDPQVLLLTVAAVTMACIAYFIYRNSENVWLSTFIFACMFFPNSFNLMRQYMALSIAINSYQFFMDRKYVRASLVILFASLFHVSAMIMFAPMIIYKIKNWNIIRNIILCSTVIFFIWGRQIVAVLMQLISKGFYITSGLYDVNRYFRITTLLTLLFSLLTWYFMKKNKNACFQNELNLFTSVSFINIIFGILYLRYEFFSRVIEIMNIFLVLSLPLAYTHVRFRSMPLVRCGMLILPFCLMLNAVYNSGSGIEQYSMFFMK